MHLLGQSAVPIWYSDGKCCPRVWKLVSIGAVCWLKLAETESELESRCGLPVSEAGPDIRWPNPPDDSLLGSLWARGPDSL